MTNSVMPVLRAAWSAQRTFLLASALTLGAIAPWVAGHLAALMCLAALGAYGLLALASLRRPLAFVTVFLAALIVLPPIYWQPLGETSIYVPTLLLPIGVAVLLLRLPDFQVPSDAIARGLIVFLLATALSLPFAWWLSGPRIGNQSFFRWLMLAQTILIYFLV